MNRRSILKLIGVSPVAAPAMVNAAAAGMTPSVGVGVLGAVRETYDYANASRGVPIAEDPTSHSNWLKQQLANLVKGRHDSFARHLRRVEKLDPDLACSRSLSVSTAIRIQRGRNFERTLKEEQRSALRRFRESFGFDFIPSPKDQGHE